MTPRIPPLGLSESPALLGIRWMWAWNTVWPADSPMLVPILNPLTEVACIPVHHGADFRDVPVVKPENLDALSGKAFFEVMVALPDTVGEHPALAFELRIFLRIRHL